MSSNIRAVYPAWAVASRAALRVGWAAVRANRRWQVVDGEGAFAAQVAGEREPPAQDRTDAVAVAGEEADVDEQPHPPPDEAAKVQPERGHHGMPAGDIGGRPEVAVLERLVIDVAPGFVADLAGRVQPGLHGDLGHAGQLVQAPHLPPHPALPLPRPRPG